MKKILVSLLILAMTVLALASCGGDGSGEGNPDSAFDTSRVTFASAYEKAQELGFEGTLDEFIAMISGTDGIDGKDGITPTVEISEDGYWVINGVKTAYKAIGEDGEKR